MTAPTDPPRLSESGSAAVQELLESTAADAPTAAELASLNAAMGSLVGTQVAATATTASSVLLKSVVLVAVGVGAIGGVMWWTATSEERPASATQAPPVVGDPTPTVGEPADEPEPASAAAPAAEPEPAPEPAPPEIEQPSSAPAPARTANARPAPPVDPADDIALLREARQAFRDGDPARALSLSAEHRRGFPNSVFTQEREAIAIEAHMRTGQRAAAQRQYERFVARWPESTYRHRLATLLEEESPSDP